MRVRGLDKSKLGRKLGMSHTNVHNKLSGERPMRVEELADFAAALDVPPSVLYGSTADVLRWLADESEGST